MTTTPAQEQQSRESFFQGIEHFEAGRLAQARTCFERCLALTPDRPSVLGNLGITLFRLGHTREALPHLQRATAGEPDFTEAWVCLGLAHEAHAQWQPAVAALTRALERSPRTPALWLSKGQCLMRLGQLPAALTAFDRALEIDPGYTAAWSVRGGPLREMRQFDAAAKSFERAIALGAEPELHAYYLAAVRGESVPPKPPRRYVEALFDDYAADFQHHLEQLDYRGHELLLRPVLDSGRRFDAALDLGCGTGLCGPLLRQCCELVDGVDLSNAMLEQARQLGVYRELVHADIGEYLAGSEQRRVDLVVAADVLIYVGEVTDVFRSVARVLTPGGLFAFTIELPTASGDRDLQLLPSLRYAHSERYVRALAAQCGLEVESLRAAPIRHEQARPVQGLYVYLRRAAA